MNTTKCCEILEESMLPHVLEKMPPNSIFEQDNDPKHSGRLGSVRCVSFGLAITISRSKPHSIFQQDNDPKNSCRLVRNYLSDHDVEDFGLVITISRSKPHRKPIGYFRSGS